MITWLCSKKSEAITEVGDQHFCWQIWAALTTVLKALMPASELGGGLPMTPGADPDPTARPPGKEARRAVTWLRSLDWPESRSVSMYVGPSPRRGLDTSGWSPGGAANMHHQIKSMHYICQYIYYGKSIKFYQIKKLFFHIDKQCSCFKS